MGLCDSWNNHSWEHGEHMEKAHIASLPKCCKSAYRDYTGQRKPHCCGGKGCQVCWMIYKAKYNPKKKTPARDKSA